jgi:hypothetical protein
VSSSTSHRKLFAAVHESGCGPSRKWRDVRVASVMSRITDMAQLKFDRAEGLTTQNLCENS